MVGVEEIAEIASASSPNWPHPIKQPHPPFPRPKEPCELTTCIPFYAIEDLHTSTALDIEHAALSLAKQFQYLIHIFLPDSALQSGVSVTGVEEIEILRPDRVDKALDTFRALGLMLVANKTLNEKASSSDNHAKIQQIEATCFRPGTGFFARFARYEKAVLTTSTSKLTSKAKTSYLPLARIHKALQELLVQVAFGDRSSVDEGKTLAIRDGPPAKLSGSLAPATNGPKLSPLRLFFADGSVMVLSNILVATMAAVALGFGLKNLSDSGKFMERNGISGADFQLALADALFRLNEVHQAFVPYLRNKGGFLKVWGFLTAFILSAICGTVAIGVIFISKGWHTIMNFVGAWFLMIGVWILITDEKGQDNSRLSEIESRGEQHLDLHLGRKKRIRSKKIYNYERDYGWRVSEHQW